MAADSSTTDLPEPLPLSEIPPAAQWMADMAAQSALSTEEVNVTKVVSPATSLGDRHRRISKSLRRSKKLLPDLDTEIREDLLRWGEELAWVVVSATEGLDDAAAEEILQPRVRALRRMLQRIAQKMTNPEEFEADSIRYIAKQAGLMTGQRVADQSVDHIAADVWAEWQHQSGTPLQQLKVMKRVVAELPAAGSGEVGAA